MNPPRRLRGAFGMCNLREGFVVAPWRLREAFSKTRPAKVSRSPLEGFAKASRRRHGRLHLKTIRQIMTSPRVQCYIKNLARGDKVLIQKHHPKGENVRDHSSPISNTERKTVMVQKHSEKTTSQKNITGIYQMKQNMNN